ncbi:hypothetical protein MNBD_GAMMA05-1109 [hydrothermal vent metagenome]|uniref:DUF1835 domain-containing protein n=1 Tax=hydrothermal vent metagenome TaxID=652676 RepID=A0A3B0WMJ8_9ZZZZ
MSNNNTLIITNGDSSVSIMQEAGVAGHILPWRDILHDGPVPGDLNLEQLAEVRADYLAQYPAGSRDYILQGINQRDEVLKSFCKFDRVIIWIEHDLYDQLQLLQLLSWFSEQPLGTTKLQIICIDHFDGVSPFYGIGQLDSEQMKMLIGTEQSISRKQLELGYHGWQAFTAATPLSLVEFMNEDLSTLPFMKAALKRHLEEFPDSITGLSRHERQILEMVNTGIHSPGLLFAAHQKIELAPYLGDWGFWSIIERLTRGEKALLQVNKGEDFVFPGRVSTEKSPNQQHLQLTDLGSDVLCGEADWLLFNPPDLWKGGVHLHQGNTLWRWNKAEEIIVS